MPFSFYYLPLTSRNCDFGKMKNATFLADARHCELILCLVTSPKCDLDEVEIAMIEVVECHFEVIFVS